MISPRCQRPPAARRASSIFAPRIMRLPWTIKPASRAAAASSLLHATLALHVALLAPPQSLALPDVLAPPTWVTTQNGVELQRMSDANTKLTDKGAKKIFDAGLALATAGADEDTQQLDTFKLRKAEQRFTELIEEFAPNYAYAYTNRANVRVALKDYAGALPDYTRALELAPLASDTWVTLLNRGTTLNALERKVEALGDLDKAVELAKKSQNNQARFALLGRGGVYHDLGRYSEASADYMTVLEVSPADVQPFWVRLALDLLETGRRPEALGFARRTSAKFDLEPETNLATCSMLWRDGSQAERDEALRRYNLLPMQTKQSMETVDLVGRGWPPNARAAAAIFLGEARPPAAAAAAPVAPVQAAAPVAAAATTTEPAVSAAAVPAAAAAPPAAAPTPTGQGDADTAAELARLRERLAELQKATGAP